MKEIEKAINKGEEVIWEGKPRFAPFFIKGFILWIVIASIISLPLIMLLPFTQYILFYVTMFFVVVLGKYQDYRNKYYAVTDKRVMVQSGIIGRDFKIIDFDQFNTAFVNVNFLDKIFKTGSIHIIGNRSVVFAHINKPYDVFKSFKKTSFDVKTDIYFPNEYRPDENPGYKTKYRPK